MTTNPIRILVSESVGFSTRAAVALRQAGDLVLADLDRRALLAAVRQAVVLWVRLRHQIDREVFTYAHQLKVIVTPTTGLNHIDLTEAEHRGVQVLSLRGETEFLEDVRATAEHTLALTLSLLRHVPEALSHVRGGGWNRDLFKGRELCGKTVGIVGYGRLGRIVARYLSAVGMHLLATDPNIEKSSVEPNVRLVPLTELLQQSDLVTLHVNLCDETREFFGKTHFALMKQGAWFINTSRGELVDEEALLDALRSGRLTGAALDVLCDERSHGMDSHPLVVYARGHDNLIITPHIGGYTTESIRKTECFLADRLRVLLDAGMVA